MESREFNRELEQLLKDPAFKDRVNAGLEYLEPETARELAGILLWSDAVFSFGLLAQLPRGLNFLAAFLEEIGKHLQQLPPQMLREFLFEMGRALDGESFKSLWRAYAPLAAAAASLTRDGDPEAHSRLEDKLERVREKMGEADFGEIRRTLNGAVDQHYPLAAEILNTILTSYNRKMAASAEKSAAQSKAASQAAASATQSTDTSPHASPSSSRGEYGARFLEYLDEEELSRALTHTSGQVATVLSTNPRLARTMLKAICKIAWGAVKGALRRPSRKRLCKSER